MSGDDQVAVVHHEVTDRGRREVEAQRLPVVTVVERHVDAPLRPGEEERASSRVLAHGVDHLVPGDPLDPFRPRLTAVPGAVDVRVQVVEPEAIHRRKCLERVEVGGLHQRDLAPGREHGRRHVAPGPAAVVRDVDQAVVGAGPDEVLPQERRRDRVNHPAVLARFGVERRERPQVRRHIVRRAREIGADRLPAPAAVHRPEQHVRAEIQDMRVQRREQERHGPDPAVLPRPHGLG